LETNVVKFDEEQYIKLSKSYGKFLGKLMAKSDPPFILDTTVPTYLVDQAVVRTYPVSKKDTIQKREHNKKMQSIPIKICINFQSINKSQIPMKMNDKIVWVEAGEDLQNSDLALANKLVGKHFSNIAVILILLYQYNSRMWDKTKPMVLDSEDDKQNIRML